MARHAPSITLDTEERAALERIVRSPTSAQRDARRARIVPLAATGHRNDQIQETLGVSKPVVVTWRRRFARWRLDGLVMSAAWAANARMTPSSATGLPPRPVPRPRSRWGRTGVCERWRPTWGAVPRWCKRCWSPKRFSPPRGRYWKHSDDPEFEPKLLAVVGLSLHPPEQAVVLGVNAKPSIQALDRTPPRLPMKPHQVERRRHEYKRNGPASLLAALEGHSGQVRGPSHPAQYQ